MPAAYEPRNDHCDGLLLSATTMLSRSSSWGTGLGALEPWLGDDDVTEVMVNGDGEVWIERSGVLHRTATTLTRREIDLLVEKRIPSFCTAAVVAAPTNAIDKRARRLLSDMLRHDLALGVHQRAGGIL